jgi:rod shape-determining protein MreC
MGLSGGSSTTLFAEGGGGTLRLLFYLGLAVTLMVADHRGGYLDRVRYLGGLLVEPIYLTVSAPARLGIYLRDSFSERRRLAEENAELRRALLVSESRLTGLSTLQDENRRLRELLDGTRGYRLKVQLASILDVDLDPFRHRILLDIGDRAGVRAGLALIDSRGLVGQVIATTPLNSTAVLVSDPGHAVPVQVPRSGLRTIAYGTGQTDRLELPNIPLSADIRVGDLLVTSGIGGRFPAGFPVAEVTDVRSDETRVFVVAQARPVAALERSGEVLLIWTEIDEERSGDLGPEPEPTP